MSPTFVRKFPTERLIRYGCGANAYVVPLVQDWHLFILTRTDDIQGRPINIQLFNEHAFRGGFYNVAGANRWTFNRMHSSLYEEIDPVIVRLAGFTVQELVGASMKVYLNAH